MDAVKKFQTSTSQPVFQFLFKYILFLLVESKLKVCLICKLVEDKNRRYNNSDDQWQKLFITCEWPNYLLPTKWKSFS